MRTTRFFNPREHSKVLYCSAAHAKSSTFGCSLDIPITAGRLNLGTWQVCHTRLDTLLAQCKVLYKMMHSVGPGRGKDSASGNQSAEPASVGLSDSGLHCTAFFWRLGKSARVVLNVGRNQSGAVLK